MNALKTLFVTGTTGYIGRNVARVYGQPVRASAETSDSPCELGTV